MPYFSLIKTILVRSKEFQIHGKPDQQHGALLKIVEMKNGRQSADKIYVTLDAAHELCDHLRSLERIYREFRPLPTMGRLAFQEMVEEDATYRLELGVVDRRQILGITQCRERSTRHPCNTITIADVREFRRELGKIVKQLSWDCFKLSVEFDNGIMKVVRGKRVGVIYCPVQPWPWGHSHMKEKLLFDHNLVRKILFKETPRNIRDYCENAYPGLMLETYVDMNYDPSTLDDVYKNLKIRWIRRGQKFRINDVHSVGTISLKYEDHFYRA